MPRGNDAVCGWPQSRRRHGHHHQPVSGRRWNVLPLQRILPYTFAAPTAGDGNFAAWFHSQFPLAPCVINKYDLVPNAWATLAELPKDHKDNPFYPDGSSTT